MIKKDNKKPDSIVAKNKGHEISYPLYFVLEYPVSDQDVMAAFATEIDADAGNFSIKSLSISSDFA